MNTDQKFQLTSTSLEQSLALGERLGRIIRPGQLIELVGDLGGGKTVLVKGLARGLGVKKQITSPSYNIARRYELPGSGFLEHFDLYRLSADQIIESQIRESIEAKKNIVAIEWAGNLSHQITADRLRIELSYIDENSRAITFSATGPRSRKLVGALK